MGEKRARRLDWSSAAMASASGSGTVGRSSLISFWILLYEMPVALARDLTEWTRPPASGCFIRRCMSAPSCTLYLSSGTVPPCGHPHPRMGIEIAKHSARRMSSTAFY